MNIENQAQVSTEEVDTAAGSTGWVIETIPNEGASEFLFEKLGSLSALFEQYVIYFANILLEDYQGGYWELRTLPNGGFFYELDQQGDVEVTWTMNYFRETMSVQAASIAASHFALTLLAEKTEADNEIQILMSLMEYATRIHPDCEKLSRLFD